MISFPSSSLALVLLLGVGVVSGQVCEFPRNMTVYQYTPDIAPVEHPKYHEDLLPHITWAPTRTPGVPTAPPTKPPTTAKPTSKPTTKPTSRPTKTPTKAPTKAPVRPPTSKPVVAPTRKPTSTPTSAPTLGADCPMFRLDFSEVQRGDWITDDFLKTYGVNISASGDSGASTPGNAARIFDTAHPGSFSYADYDLASPHNTCGGIGTGNGGAKGSAFENCIPQGNVLIIQESGSSDPNDYWKGGTITFEFAYPVDLESMTIMDADEAGETPRAKLTYSNGQTYTHTCAFTGENGVSTERIFKNSVKKIEFTTTGSGVVSAIDYRWCPPSDNYWNDARKMVEAVGPAQNCPLKVLAFNKNADTYITNEFWTSDNVFVNAYPMGTSNTPNFAARILDTRNQNSPTDMKTPNQNCNCIGSINKCGVGDGGKSTGMAPNCANEGKALVVSKDASSSNTADGPGSIRFKFRYPAYIESVRILNIPSTSCEPKLMTVDWKGSATTESTFTRTGTNGIRTQSIAVDEVREFWVKLPSGGGITQLSYRICVP